MTQTSVRRIVVLTLSLGLVATVVCSAACTSAPPTEPRAEAPAITTPPAPATPTAVLDAAAVTPAATPTLVATSTAVASPVSAAPTSGTVAPAQLPAAFVEPIKPVPPTPTSVPVAKPGPAFQVGNRPTGTLPASISIPRLHSHADIVTLSTQGDGSDMAVPSDPDTIGWYDFTATLGIPGNAVLVGHVDWAGQLRAFGRLRDLREGDTVEIVDSLDRSLSYTVESTEVIDATTAPTEYLSQRGPDEELTLITCGGAFDHATHQYLSRVIVRAVRGDAASTVAAN